MSLKKQLADPGNSIFDNARVHGRDQRRNCAFSGREYAVIKVMGIKGEFKRKIHPFMNKYDESERLSIVAFSNHELI